jgi:ABC-type multidrug transport system fused ATPase/permease subunit
MSNDVTEVENSVMSSLDMTFKNFIMMVIYFTAMLIISWELTLFVLILLPIAGFLLGRVSKQLKKPSREGQAQWGELLSQIEETLTGLRIIKAFNAKTRIQSTSSGKTKTLKRTIQKDNPPATTGSPNEVNFWGTAIIAIVLWFGGSLILTESSSAITAPVFIYYLIIFYSIINPAKAFSQAWYNIQKGLASMERIDRILLTENHIKDPKHPVELKEFKQSIEYKNVGFKYQTEPVLEDINIQLTKGQTIALVGQSGSGKSTLVDLLPRFLRCEYR